MANSKNKKTEVTLDALLDEHKALEDRLSELDKRPYLTPSEQAEKQTIKKLKLLKKDQIAILTRKANA